MQFLKGHRVLITGGCGTVGHELCKRLTQNNIETFVFSRNEAAQFKLKEVYPNVTCILGDIKDRYAIERAFAKYSPTVVIHAAAVKVVPVAEKEMTNTIETNVLGSYNVVQACLNFNVKYALAIGTDKQVAPVNVYGMSKHLMSSLFSDANRLGKTTFASVRYGNVLCSRSSLGVILLNQAKAGKKLTITDPTMTRFFFPIQDGVDLIEYALKHMLGGEGFSKFEYGVTLTTQMCAALLQDVAEAISSKYNTTYEVIGRRPGEKTHEDLLAEYEVKDTMMSKEVYTPWYAKNAKLKKYIFIPHSNIGAYAQNYEKECYTGLKFSSDDAYRLSKEEILNLLDYASKNTFQD